MFPLSHRILVLVVTGIAWAVSVTGQGPDGDFVTVDPMPDGPTIPDVEFDPHVTQYIHGSGKPLCYDVTGEVGDTFSFVNNEAIGLKINARLISLGSGDRALYMGEILVRLPDFSLAADVQKVVLNGESMPWQVHSEQLQSADDGTEVEVEEKVVRIQHGPTVIKIRRMPNFLNFDFEKGGSSAARGAGILGDVRSRCYLQETEDGALLVVTGKDGNTAAPIELTQQPACWKVPYRSLNADQLFGQIITGNKVNCLDC